MSLIDKINEDIKKTMLAREKEKLEALRAIKSALLLALTSEGAEGKITEDTEIKLLQKLVKQRKESADIYQHQNRPELANTELFQAEVISTYLPSQMDEAALKSFIQQLIKDMGVTGIKEMGKVMAAASQKLAGKAESKTIAGIIKELLQ